MMEVKPCSLYLKALSHPLVKFIFCLKITYFLFYSYEKMISGMYMGEIARLAIERLRKNNLLFEGEGSYHLSTRGRFYTKYVSEIEG